MPILKTQLLLHNALLMANKKNGHLQQGMIVLLPVICRWRKSWAVLFTQNIGIGPEQDQKNTDLRRTPFCPTNRTKVYIQTALWNLMQNKVSKRQEVQTASWRFALSKTGTFCSLLRVQIPTSFLRFTG